MPSQIPGMYGNSSSLLELVSSLLLRTLTTEAYPILGLWINFFSPEDVFVEKVVTQLGRISICAVALGNSRKSDAPVLGRS